MKVQLEELLFGLVFEWRAIAAGKRRDPLWPAVGQMSVKLHGMAEAYLDCAEQLERILPREEVEAQRGNAGTTR